MSVYLPTGILYLDTLPFKNEDKKRRHFRYAKIQKVPYSQTLWNFCTCVSAKKTINQETWESQMRRKAARGIFTKKAVSLRGNGQERRGTKASETAAALGISGGLIENPGHLR